MKYMPYLLAILTCPTASVRLRLEGRVCEMLSGGEEWFRRPKNWHDLVFWV
jgi:hypothetical protein